MGGGRRVGRAQAGSKSTPAGWVVHRDARAGLDLRRGSDGGARTIVRMDDLEYTGLMAEAWDALRGDTSDWADRRCFLGSDPGARRAGPRRRLRDGAAAAGLPRAGHRHRRAGDLALTCSRSCGRESRGAVSTSTGASTRARCETMALPRAYATIMVPSSSFQLAVRRTDAVAAARPVRRRISSRAARVAMPFIRLPGAGYDEHWTREATLADGTLRPADLARLASTRRSGSSRPTSAGMCMRDGVGAFGRAEGRARRRRGRGPIAAIAGAATRRPGSSTSTWWSEIHAANPMRPPTDEVVDRGRAPAGLSGAPAVVSRVTGSPSAAMAAGRGDADASGAAVVSGRSRRCRPRWRPRRPSASPAWLSPVVRRPAAMMAPDTPVPIAVPRVSERLSALDAVPWVPGARLAQHDERERRVAETHPEARRSRRSARPRSPGPRARRIMPNEARPMTATRNPAVTNRAVGHRSALRAWIHDPVVHDTVAAVRTMPGHDRRQPAVLLEGERHVGVDPEEHERHHAAQQDGRGQDRPGRRACPRASGDGSPGRRAAGRARRAPMVGSSSPIVSPTVIKPGTEPRPAARSAAGVARRSRRRPRRLPRRRSRGRRRGPGS